MTFTTSPPHTTSSPFTGEVLVELRALYEVGAITSEQLVAATAYIVVETDMDEYDNMRVGDCADLMLTLASI
jgi:hypothetical protein